MNGREPHQLAAAIRFEDSIEDLRFDAGVTGSFIFLVGFHLFLIVTGPDQIKKF